MSNCKLYLCLATFCFVLWISNTNGLVDLTIRNGLFYPFGTDQGDHVVPVGYDTSGLVSLNQAVWFGSDAFVQLYVQTQGIISFGLPFLEYTPKPFPTNQRGLLAVYWAGVDTSLNSGRVYYRLTNDSTLLKRAADDVQTEFADVDQLFSFVPSNLLIATWHNVTFNGYGNAKTPVNSFQVILAWNKRATAALFRYAKLTWTTGGNSGGTSQGKGGFPAEMGFNTGDGFFFKHTWSLTSDIIYLTNNSNTQNNAPGHYCLRVDKPTNKSDCSDYDTALDNRCPLVYQSVDESSGLCSDIFPSFGCPFLEGPIVTSPRTIDESFEFLCHFVNGSLDAAARFEVMFLFNGQSDCSVPRACQKGLTANQVAVLNSNNLRGKAKMGKTLSCKVSSYWSFSDRTQSKYFISNGYFMGLEFSTRNIGASEDKITPEYIWIKSTVPITCPDQLSAAPCSVTFRYEITTTDGSTTLFGFRQRYPGTSKTSYVLSPSCRFIIKQTDWKSSEQRAYNENGALHVIAQLDLYTIAPRTALLTFSIDSDTTNQSIWYRYQSPVIQLYHQDVAKPVSICYLSGDPHLTNFDGSGFSVQCNGIFSYVRSATGSRPVEVQVRHCPCGNGDVSCVCGIALRENGEILVADLCTEYGTIQFFRLISGQCGQDTNCGSHTRNNQFKLVTPNGNRVYGTVYGSAMNAQIIITARSSDVNGLCGSPDGNKFNDWSFKDSNRTLTIPDVTDPWPPKSLVDSWAVLPSQTLFDLKTDPTLPDVEETGLLDFCSCLKNVQPVCGSSAVTDPNWPGEINSSLRATGASQVADNYCGTWKPSANCRENSKRKRSLLWPTASGITLEKANFTCWSGIMNVANLGPRCMEIMMNDTSRAKGIVNDCISDIQLTDSLSWAADKINGAQQFCYFQEITRNTSDVNDTSEAISQVQANVKEITNFICVPQDCSAHGSCVNGTCHCVADYIGSGCHVLRSAVPKILLVQSRPFIDIGKAGGIDDYGVDLITSDAADVPTMTCKFDATVSSGLTATYIYPGQVTSSFINSTVVCALPRKLTGYVSWKTTFSDLHGAGFNFSCLTPGGSVTTVKISISNDGLKFSNSMTLTLYDSQCIVCTGSSCVPRPNTCNINGWCFADQDPNPYLQGCQTCNSKVSISSWTTAQNADSNTCVTASACGDGQFCVSQMDFKYNCSTILTPVPNSASAIISAPPRCFKANRSGLCEELTGSTAEYNAFSFLSERLWRLIYAQPIICVCLVVTSSFV